MINFNTTVQDKLEIILTEYFLKNSLIRLDRIIVRDGNGGNGVNSPAILANYQEDIRDYKSTQCKNILRNNFKKKLTSEFEKLELYQDISTPLGGRINQKSISRSLRILLIIPGEEIDDKTNYESFLLGSSECISNVVLKFRDMFQDQFKEHDVKFNCLFQLDLYSLKEDPNSVKCSFYCRIFAFTEEENVAL
jgi:hypothetical protein